MASVGTKKGEKEYLVWSPFLLAGQKAYRYELANGTTAEVLPDFDLEGRGFHWGVLFPEKRHRVNGAMVVLHSAKRVGGRVRLLDEDGSLHYAKSLEEAKERAKAALEAGRPPDSANEIRGRMGASE